MKYGFKGLLSTLPKGTKGSFLNVSVLGLLVDLAGYKATAISLKRTLERINIVYSGKCRRPPIEVLRGTRNQT
jgi:hypothetical protein